MTAKFLHAWVDGATCVRGCLFCSPIAGLRRPGWENLAPAELDTVLHRAEPGELATLCFYGHGILDMSAEIQAELRTRVGVAREQGRVGPVRISLRSDQVKEEELIPWMRVGLTQVELQVSSQADRARLWQGPSHHHTQVALAAALLRGLGLELVVHLHPGGPGSDPPSDVADLRWALNLQASRLRITPVLVIGGTQLSRAWRGRLFQPLSLAAGIELGCQLLSIADEAGVAVIRYGWQPADLRINSSEILAGPFHPSLRGLVESARLLERAKHLLLDKVRPGHDLLLKVCPEQEQWLRGVQNSNLQQLRYLLRCRSIRVQADPGLPPGELGWSAQSSSVTLNMSHSVDM